MTPIPVVASLKATLLKEMAAAITRPSPFQCDACYDSGWSAVIVEGVERLARCVCKKPALVVNGSPDT